MTSQSNSNHHDDAPVTVSVLVPVLNEERHIRATVAAMQAQRLEGTPEFLFMDGRSEDRTRAILEELARSDPRIRVLDNPRRRTADGLNVGLANARGEFVARMDAHAFYEPDYLALGIERLRRGGVDWVSGPQLPYGDGKWSRRVALALETGVATVGSRKWTANGGERELDTGVWCGVWRRSVLEAHGGWDPGWPVNQDSELASRALARGERLVLLPEMAGRYIPRNSLRSLARQYARYGYYRAKTARRHPHSARRSHVMAPAVAAAIPAALAGPRPVRRLARAGLAAYAAALGAVAVRASGEAPRADAAALPVVSAVMHVSWGAGYIWSSIRGGPPVAALVRMLRGS
jgi:glycosyltransferase involved in cell wall biosynthesis